MRKPIEIGKWMFPTKKAATERLREALYRYPVGTEVTEADDIDLLSGAILRHPEADMKIGVGISRFEVRKNDGSVGFWIVRCDGSATDFSFYACLTPPTHAQNLRRALRTEIRDQVQSFKASALAGGALCAVTGAPLDPERCHVDHHDPTFEVLVGWFLRMCELKEADLAVNETADGSTETRLADREWADYWATFHQQHAKLRLVTPEANLSLLRRRK